MSKKTMAEKKWVNIFWFRRDLRLQDNHGLDAALSSDLPVVPIFIFDQNILSKLHDRCDARVTYIYKALEEIQNQLQPQGAGLLVELGKPVDVFAKLLVSFNVRAVYTNSDYEPAAIERDKKVAAFLKSKDVDFFVAKDQVIFEKSEVVKDDGKPYSVFTAYARKWRANLSRNSTQEFTSHKKLSSLLKLKSQLPCLTDIGFEATTRNLPAPNVSASLLKNYGEQRNFPALPATSRIGLALRFGTLSVREAVKLAHKYSPVWLNELIWREFFMQLLYHYPHTVDQPFKSNFKVNYLNQESDFKTWTAAKTGYPIVDAGLRELRATGFMHNRVRMIVASFLCKHLLIDWRWGERFFAQHLLDFELASNVGNWQWVAGCGADAAPYFRIFNPALQAKKFDPDGEYVKLWVPEWGSNEYPEPLIDHEFARRRALIARS